MSQESSSTPAPGAGPPELRRAGRPSRRARRMIVTWVRRGLLALIALGLIGAIVWANLPKPVPVDMAGASRGIMSVEVRDDGRTRVKDRFIVSAPIAGHMPRMDLEPSDSVAEGQVLARIVPLTPPLLDQRTLAEAEARVAAALANERLYRSRIETARTAHALAEREVERQRKLWERAATTEQALEQAQFTEKARKEELTSAEFAVKVAAQEVNMARASLTRLQGGANVPKTQELLLQSPVSGQVLRVLRESEGVIQPGEPIVEIGDPKALEVVSDILTTDAVHVRVGAPVIIERWGGDKELKGHVDRVEPSAFTHVSALGVEEQRVNVVIAIDSPHQDWAALGDAFRVEVRILIWQEDDVIRVPASAVFRAGDGWALYRVVAGTSELTPIEIGRRNDSSVQVTSGIAAGDQVVLHPSDRVQNGVRVIERR